MTARDPEPINPTRCPWHNTTTCVEPATDHEQHRTGCRWICTEGAGRLFHGTQAEYARIRAQVSAEWAERQATSPNPEDHR